MQSIGKDAVGGSAHIANIDSAKHEKPRHAHGLIEAAHLYQGNFPFFSRPGEVLKLNFSQRTVMGRSLGEFSFHDQQPIP
jgi:hypothetical protein